MLNDRASRYPNRGCATGGHDSRTCPTGTLQIIIDWSGSCVHAALEEAWNTVKTELPKIVETYHVTDLSISSFDEDGWSPTRLKELPLPVLNLPAHQKPNPTEWDSFRNIRDAVREAEEGKRRKEMSQAEGAYERALREALAALDFETIIPEPQRQSKRTDIVGLLKRIAETQSQHPQFVIVLTDLADTQYRELPHIAAPQIETHVLVLLIPAEPKDALLTIGKPLSGQE